jgi:hypothetical protein
MVRIDPVKAFLEGFTSVWSRTLFFFVAAIFAHAIGLCGALLMYEDGYFFDFDPDTFAALPASWMIAVIRSLAHPLGPAFAGGLILLFLLIVFSEKSLVHLVTVLVLLQSWGTFLVHRFVRDEGAWTFPFVDIDPPFAALGYAIPGGFSLAVLTLYITFLVARGRALKRMAMESKSGPGSVRRAPRADPRKARLDLWREDRD